MWIALAVFARPPHLLLQLVTGKVTAVHDVLKQTRVAQLLSTLDDGPIISSLMGKLNTAKDLLRKAADKPDVVATGGN